MSVEKKKDKPDETSTMVGKPSSPSKSKKSVITEQEKNKSSQQAIIEIQQRLSELG